LQTQTAVTPFSLLLSLHRHALTGMMWTNFSDTHIQKHSESLWWHCN